MLVLTRNVSQCIIVGDDIIITVLGVRGGQVRIGVDAPKDISVHRKEIYEKIQREGYKKPPSKKSNILHLNSV